MTVIPGLLQILPAFRYNPEALPHRNVVVMILLYMGQHPFLYLDSNTKLEKY